MVQVTSPQSGLRFVTSVENITLRLLELQGREALSQPYHYQLKLRVPLSQNVKANDLVGKSAHVCFDIPPVALAAATALAAAANAADDSSESTSTIPTPSATRDLCGILTRVQYLGTDDAEHHLQAVLRPRLWTFSLSKRYRAFHQKSTKQIVSTVLGSLPIRWDLQATLAPRNYCVQYGESDLDFVTRVLAEDGLTYWFEHQYSGQPTDPSERLERIVVSDTLDGTPDETSLPVPMNAASESNATPCSVRSWTVTTTLTPSDVEVIDRHFQDIATPVHAQKSLPTAQAVAGQNEQDYATALGARVDAVDASGSYQETTLSALPTIANTWATQRREQWNNQAVTYEGQSDIAWFEVGQPFRLKWPGQGALETYYLTELTQTVRLSNPAYSGRMDTSLTYQNQFHCLPKLHTYRPPVPETPKILGVVPATVVNSSGGTDPRDVHVDRYGRVKVKFPWHGASEASSCWIRVGQFWAGPRWGAFFWPRAGHEVLVAFEHGDPNRPVIIGSVYNSANMPPLPLPDYKESCGVRSCSTHGSPTRESSTLVFHDEAGSEYLSIHAESNLSMSAETTALSWSAGEQIEFKGHHWLFDLLGPVSSGGGGSDSSGNDEAACGAYKPEESEGFSVAEMFQDLLLASDKGNIGYTVGDSFKKQFGRSFESYYGCNVWLGCDPVELIEHLTEERFGTFSVASALVPTILGAGGQGKTLLGGTHDLHYGTSVKAHRGYKYENISLNAVKSHGNTILGNMISIEQKLGKIAVLGVKILLALDLLIMLLTRAALNSSKEAWKGFIKFSEIWSLNILPRLQGLIEFIETMAAKVKAIARKVEAVYSDSENLVERLVRVLLSTDHAHGDSTDAAKGQAKTVVEEITTIERFLKRLLPAAD